MIDMAPSAATVIIGVHRPLACWPLFVYGSSKSLGIHMFRGFHPGIMGRRVAFRDNTHNEKWGHVPLSITSLARTYDLYVLLRTGVPEWG